MSFQAKVKKRVNVSKLARDNGNQIQPEYNVTPVKAKTTRASKDILYQSMLNLTSGSRSINQSTSTTRLFKTIPKKDESVPSTFTRRTYNTLNIGSNHRNELNRHI